MYHVLASDKVVFCDVDDTLIIWEGRSYRPHKKHIDMLHKFHERGQPIVVWSAGGYEWAETIVKELGLSDIVEFIMCKPSWFIDDLPAAEFLPEINRIYLKDEEEVPV